MKRVTLDTNVIGTVLNHGSPFRQRLEQREFQVFVAEAALTLDGLANRGKLELLALKNVKRAVKKTKWDDYINLGITFLLCPRIGMPRPEYKDEEGNLIEYTLLHKAPEHTYNQEERQNRYFEVLQYIEGDLKAGKKWLVDLQDEITRVGGEYNPDIPWFQNLTNNIIQLGNKIRKRFGDWADADAIASHYAYGNDIFCTNDNAKGSGASSVMSASNRKLLVERFEINIKPLNELI